MLLPNARRGETWYDETPGKINQAKFTRVVVIQCEAPWSYAHQGRVEQLTWFPG